MRWLLFCCKIRPTRRGCKNPSSRTVISEIIRLTIRKRHSYYTNIALAIMSTARIRHSYFEVVVLTIRMTIRIMSLLSNL